VFRRGERRREIGEAYLQHGAGDGIERGLGSLKVEGAVDVRGVLARLQRQRR
jgi:hypothetical protein